MTIYEDGKPVGKLTADEARVLMRLLSRKKELDLCQDDGIPLMRLVPEVALADAELTEEEVQRRRTAPGAMTLAEFWKKMGVR